MVLKMISVRWRPSSKPFFKIVHDTGQQLTIDPYGWLPSNHSTYGVCECEHVISNTPKGKNHMLKDRESEGATARLRNGK
jgi:hypothetical protein